MDLRLELVSQTDETIRPNTEHFIIKFGEVLVNRAALLGLVDNLLNSLQLCISSYSIIGQTWIKMTHPY